MASLTTCLGKAGPYLSAADKAAVNKRAGEYRRQGMDPMEAARAAIGDVLEQVRGEIGRQGERGREGDEADPQQTLNKDGDQGPRAQIAFPSNIAAEPSVITLLPQADFSSFIHELGHFFLQVQADVAARVQAQQMSGASITEGEQRLLDDTNRVLGWFGVKGAEGLSALDVWHTMTLDEQRAHHEQFARGFERYVFEGRAPSVELTGIFQRFGAWLRRVYQSLRDLNVELTDEVRGVMDRMIASEDEIRTAEAARSMGPLFETAARAGMTPEQWAQYQALGEAATANAIDALAARGLRDMKWLANAQSRKLRELQQSLAEVRRAVRMEARAEVMQRPVYRAWAFLTGKAAAPEQTAQPDPKDKPGRGLDATRDSLLVAIAKLGGISRDSALRDLSVVEDELKVASGVFGAPVFRKTGGMSADDMREALTELGYLRQFDEHGRTELREMSDLVRDEIGGSPVYSIAHDYGRHFAADEPAQALPEDVFAGKLDTAELRERYGMAEDAVWRRLSTRRMTSEKTGIGVDVVAETFGFTSGDELVQALAAAEPPAQVIEAETDRLMLERHGDLATPEGLQQAVDAALHDEARARMIAAELDALAAAAPKERDARGRRTVDVMAAAARDVARQIVGRLRIRDVQPARYQAAEARAAREAAAAFRKGDTAAAAEAKRRQLMQHAAAAEAIRVRAEAEKARAYLRRLAARPKSIPADYLDQIEALLERHDLKARSDSASDKRASFAAWVQSQLSLGHIPDFSETLLSPQEAAQFRADLQARNADGTPIYDDDEKIATRLAAGIERSAAVPWREMTVEQMRGLVDAARQIEHLGRLKGRLLANRDRATYEAARDEIAASVVQHGGTPRPPSDRRTRDDFIGRKWQAIVAFGSSHIKASTWARILDGHQDNGPFWRNIVRPANERASWESTQRAEATQRLSAILGPVLKRVSMGDRAGRGTHFASIGDSLNWQERFALALNTGNEGNLQRLLDGRGWTRAQIEPVLRSLTADEWRAVQAVWDFFESYRPQIAELERRTTGKEPNWVLPMPQQVQTADGQTLSLRGGYYPIRYDARESARAESHADAEQAKEMMRAAYNAASTRRSFVKPRAEEVKGRPLLLNLQGLYGGVNDVIHDLAWREWLMDTGKLLRSETIQNAVRTHYGPDVMREFKRWMEDIAAGSKRLDHGIERAAGFVRQNVSMAALSYNLLTAATQLIGASNSMARVGIEPMARAMAAYAGSPLRMTREAMEASEFLRNRTRTRFRELNELRNRVEGQTTAREVIGRYGYWLMLRMQLMVDVPTWWAAHDKAIADGLDEATAVALGDQAVKDAQGGGEEVDQAGIERGGPLVKVFTAFYSYMNATLNTAVLAGTSPASHARKAANLLLVLSVPAVLGTLLKAALMPGGDDEPEDLARKLAAEQASFLFGLIAFGREFAFLGKQAFGEPAFAYGGPAGLRTIADVQKLGVQARQGELDAAFAKAFVGVLGDLTGLPSVQINRTITGATAITGGEVQGPLDSARALVFGVEK